MGFINLNFVFFVFVFFVFGLVHWQLSSSKFHSESDTVFSESQAERDSDHVLTSLYIGTPALMPLAVGLQLRSLSQPGSGFCGVLGLFQSLFCFFLSGLASVQLEQEPELTRT